jgi:hypothetical protein
VFEYLAQDVHQEVLEALAQTPHSEALWRIRLECAHTGCGKRYSIYTMYLTSVSVRDVAEALVAKNSKLLCVHDVGVCVERDAARAYGAKSADRANHRRTGRNHQEARKAGRSKE